MVIYYEICETIFSEFHKFHIKNDLRVKICLGNYTGHISNCFEFYLAQFVTNQKG